MDAPTNGIRLVTSGRLPGTTYGVSTYKVYESCHGVPPNQPPILVTWLHGADMGDIPSSDLRSIQRHLKRRCFFVVPMNPKAADDGRRFFWGVSYTKAQNKRVLGFIFGEPHDPFLADLCNLISEVAEEVDAYRIYVAGYSMGGFGAFQLGAFMPEIFDAVISVAGYGQGTQQPETEGYRAPQPQSSQILKTWIARCAPKLAQVPAVMVVHAETDLDSPYVDAVAIVKAIHAEGGQGHVELITVPDEMAESDPRGRKALKTGHRYFNYSLLHDSSEEVLYDPLEEILSGVSVVREQNQIFSRRPKPCFATASSAPARTLGTFMQPPAGYAAVNLAARGLVTARASAQSGDSSSARAQRLYQPILPMDAFGLAGSQGTAHDGAMSSVSEALHLATDFSEQRRRLADVSGNTLYRTSSGSRDEKDSLFPEAEQLFGLGSFRRM